MVHLQVICALLGTLALVNARRNKAETSTLFDQRKQNRRRILDSMKNTNNGTSRVPNRMDSSSTSGGLRSSTSGGLSSGVSGGGSRIIEFGDNAFSDKPQI